ncbi:MAG TPA: hypothetical protein VMM78_06570 [Thermomicrobiales bacterium]|nr:hypothetical protein [Thermomicrobiales bacterium]
MPSAILQRMSVRRNPHAQTTLHPDATDLARQALAECRLRGLPAAEEYRVIADRLYRAGFRDLPPGRLLAWIEESVSVNYERFIELRALGDRFLGSIARGDLAQAAWTLAAELDSEARQRLIDGIIRLNEIERRERA